MRHWLWRAVFGVAGGLTVRGALPSGGCVVVANHRSHADAPALLAALPPGSRPRVAAAADYWFRSKVRAIVCRRLVGGFAVRRDGGGSADLARMQGLLADGGTVVVLPEGTRSRDGRLGRFRSGALRLAESASVPVVPVALVGTERVLPVHGRPHRARVEVRIGAPMRSYDADAVHAAVRELLDQPTQPVDSRWRVAVARFARSPWALLSVFAWAMAEALSWPVVPEVSIGVLVLARIPWPRVALLVAAGTVGSVVGSLAGYELAASGHAAPALLTTSRMHAVASAQTHASGADAVRRQPWSGIPVKVYAAEAGREHVDVVAFAEQTAMARGSRLFCVAAAVAALSRLFARRRYAWWLVGLLALYTAGLVRVVHHWS